jgi:hypothetical protein
LVGQIWRGRSQHRTLDWVIGMSVCMLIPMIPDVRIDAVPSRAIGDRSSTCVSGRRPGGKDSRLGDGGGLLIVVKEGVQLGQLELDGGEGGLQLPLGEGSVELSCGGLQSRVAFLVLLCAEDTISVRHLSTTDSCLVKPSLISSQICFISSSISNLLFSSIASSFFCRRVVKWSCSSSMGWDH